MRVCQWQARQSISMMPFTGPSESAQRKIQRHLLVNVLFLCSYVRKRRVLMEFMRRVGSRCSSKLCGFVLPNHLGVFILAQCSHQHRRQRPLRRRKNTIHRCRCFLFVFCSFCRYGRRITCKLSESELCMRRWSRSSLGWPSVSLLEFSQTL